MASSSSKKAQIQVCTFCKEEKVTEWICSDCGKPLCYECKRYHLWDFERKDHDIVRVIQLESKVYEKQILKKINCRNHKDHYCTNYCIECKCLVCPECVSITSFHSRHTFKTINTIHEETMKKLELEENRIKQNLLPPLTQNLKLLKDWSTFHEEKFNKEKEKILKRADELKKWITECSDDLVNELTQTLVKNADVISQEKVKLEQLQGELKEKIKLINKSKVKDDIEQILNDVRNVSINMMNIPLFVPTETKNIVVSKETKQNFSAKRFFGYFIKGDGRADVKCKITNSYNLKGFYGEAYKKWYHQSVAANDGTIMIGYKKHLLEMKPDKTPEMKYMKYTPITNMLVLGKNELVFTVGDSNAIQLRNTHDEIRTLYTIPEEEQNIILALCGSRDGNIFILYSRNYTSLVYTRLSMFGTCYLAVISQNGILVQTITCEDKFLGKQFSPLSFFFSPRHFEMKENTYNTVCIINFLEDKVKGFGQDGKLKWTYCANQPVDVESAPLGSTIVLCNEIECDFVILDSNGYLLKHISFNHYFNNYDSSKNLYGFCFKNDKELAILSEETLHIVQFSFVV